MARVNPANVVQLLVDEFGVLKTPVTLEDVALADNLIAIIRQEIQTPSTVFDTYSTLGFDENQLEVSDTDELEDDHQIEEATQSSGSSFEPSPAENSRRSFDEFDNDKREEIVTYWRSSKRKAHRSLASVQKKFRSVINEPHLYYLEKLVKQRCVKSDYQSKLKMIDDLTYQKFSEANAAFLRLHDHDIKRFALHFNRTVVHLAKFVASPSWITKFKSRHGICPRIVTNVVTPKMIENLPLVIETGKKFVASNRHWFGTIPLSNIFNTDQSGFKRELHSRSTLTFIGTKKVERLAQQVDATTHSYSIQPLLSADGILHAPLPVILQEFGDAAKEGNFGPLVVKKMFKPTNIFPMCSSSGLVTKQVMKKWYSEVLLPIIDDGSQIVLFHDSLKTFDCVPAETEVSSVKSLTRLTFPPKTTGMIQPCDVLLFKTWKDFVRRISDRLLMDEAPINLFQRDSILKLQSLVFHQLRAPIFRDFHRQAWAIAGFRDRILEHYEKPIDYCFSVTGCCKVDGCEELELLKCGWCGMGLCVQHFFIDYHFSCIAETSACL